MARIRLVVVDDHTLFRAGLVSLLRETDEFQVVGEASNGLSALEVIEKTQPDVVLLDVNMPEMGGVETVVALKQRNQKVRILMLTVSKKDIDLIGAITAGADGYLLKSAEPEELWRAIQMVHQGLGFLSPEVTRQVLRRVGSETVHTEVYDLSGRELQVLQCLAQGKTTLQISNDLFISENTVKTHIRHILEKLGSSNRAEAVSKAVQIGLIHES